MRSLNYTAAAFAIIFVSQVGVEGQDNKKKVEIPALIQSLSRKDFAKAKSLIESGADPNAKDSDGLTALGYVVSNNRKELAELLIAKGARLNDKDNGGFTPLLGAASEKLSNMAILLLNHGADPNVYVAKGDLSPITIAAASGDAALITALLDKGAKIDMAGRRDDTPLMTVLRKGNQPLIDLLIARGASLNAKNKDGETALMLAARFGKPELLKRMMDKRADVKTADRDGRDALMYAVEGGSLPCVEALLAAGADPLVRDAHGRTALMSAHGDGAGEIISALIRKGADVNARDKFGCSALMRAAQRNDHPTIRLLLGQSADIKSRDTRGRTALQRARAVGSLGACDLLENGGTAAESAAGSERTDFLQHLVRTSVQRLEYSSAKFRDQVGGTCFSCHNQSMVEYALRAVRDRGFAVDGKNVALDNAVVYGEFAKCAGPMAKSVKAGKRLADAELNQHFPGAASHIGYGLLGLSAWDQKPDRATDAVTRYLPLIQQKDGHWQTNCSVRAPAENSNFTETALSIFCLKKYVQPQNAASVQASVNSARSWLIKNEPKTTEDKTFRLFGLVWSGLGRDNTEVKKAADQLLREQKEDGGWAQESGMQSDAYATGEVLVALRRAAGMPADALVYRNGVNYLLRNVEEDGSWYVRSRTVPFQGYIDTGFPYHQDQFISITASCWATVAIAEELPLASSKTARK